MTIEHRGNGIRRKHPLESCHAVATYNGWLPESCCFSSECRHGRVAVQLVDYEVALHQFHHYFSVGATGNFDELDIVAFGSNIFNGLSNAISSFRMGLRRRVKDAYRAVRCIRVR